MSQLGAIEIKIKCIGDPGTAISQALEVSKALKHKIALSFEGYEINISPESYFLDLMEINRLKKDAK